MIYLIIFSILITLLLNICFVKKIQNKTSRLTLYFCNIIFSVIFILLMLFCKFSLVGINYLVDNQIEKLENKINDYYPNALSKEFDTSQIKTMLNELLNTEISEVDVVQNIIYDSISDLTSNTLNILETVDGQNNKATIKNTMIKLKEISLDKISPYLNLLKIIFISIYAIYILISFIITLCCMKNKKKQTSGIIFGEEADKISAGMENKN